MPAFKPGFSCLATRGREWGRRELHFKDWQKLRRENLGSRGPNPPSPPHPRPALQTAGGNSKAWNGLGVSFFLFFKFTNSLAAMSTEARLLTRSPGNDSNMAPSKTWQFPRLGDFYWVRPPPSHANALQVSEAYGINHRHPVKVMNLRWPS